MADGALETINEGGIPADMSAEDVEREVHFMLLGLQSSEELMEVCRIIDLEIPPEVQGQGNTKSVYKLISRYLNSETLEESDDGGLGIFLNLYTHLVGENEQKAPVVVETVPVVSENNVPVVTTVPLTATTSTVNPVSINSNSNLLNTSVSSSVVHKRKPLFDIQKLKDFKIHGTIGGEKKSDSIKFSSLKYQISSGQDQGYTETVICAAVLKAIAPGNPLRTYLENTPALSVKSLLEVLRSHFHEKDSSSAFTDLCNAAQSVDENPHDFVVRVLVLRQNVITLSREEGVPYDLNLVQKRFLHTIETGLRNSNIRSELRDKLVFNAALPVADEVLLRAISEAMTNESERTGKFGKSKVRFSDVLAIEDTVKSDTTVKSDVKKKQNGMQSQIQELESKQEKEMSALRSDLCEIKTALQQAVMGHNRFSGPGRQMFARRNKCKKCLDSTNPERCPHCFKCFSTEHKSVDCPKNGE